MTWGRVEVASLVDDEAHPTNRAASTHAKSAARRMARVYARRLSEAGALPRLNER
jgi:hypothetical protein